MPYVAMPGPGDTQDRQTALKCHIGLVPSLIVDSSYVSTKTSKEVQVLGEAAITLDNDLSNTYLTYTFD